MARVIKMGDADGDQKDDSLIARTTGHKARPNSIVVMERLRWGWRQFLGGGDVSELPQGGLGQEIAVDAKG